QAPSGQGSIPPTCPPTFGRAGPRGANWTPNRRSRRGNFCWRSGKLKQPGPARPPDRLAIGSCQSVGIAARSRAGGGQVGGGSPCSDDGRTSRLYAIALLSAGRRTLQVLPAKILAPEAASRVV